MTAPDTAAMPAFDHHSAGYDAVAESALGRELRRRVHDVLVALVGPDTLVVDMGCGTGIDAASLGERGRHVLAFDESAAMIDVARGRCAHLSNVTVERGTIGEVTVDERVDLVVANFGVVNCVDAATLRTQLCALLAPGGHAVLVTMTRWCPIELATGVVTANRSLVNRRRPATKDPGYPGLMPRYASARNLAADLVPDFELTAAESLGLVLPPFEQRAWLESKPRTRGVLADLDRRIGRLGAAAGIGDHHIAVFVRSER